MQKVNLLPPGKRVKIAVLVLVLAGTMAGLLGALAALLYWEPPPPAGSVSDKSEVPLSTVGFASGAGSGVLVAVLWCWLLFRRTASGRTQRLPAWGAFAGIGAGVASTVLLHLALMIAVGKPDFDPMAFGLVFGVPAGALLGWPCGVWCRNELASGNGLDAGTGPTGGDRPENGSA